MREELFVRMLGPMLPKNEILSAKDHPIIRKKRIDQNIIVKTGTLLDLEIEVHCLFSITDTSIKLYDQLSNMHVIMHKIILQHFVEETKRSLRLHQGLDNILDIYTFNMKMTTCFSSNN
jgi:hypothetical protein